MDFREAKRTNEGRCEMGQRKRLECRDERKKVKERVEGRQRKKKRGGMADERAGEMRWSWR